MERHDLSDKQRDALLDFTKRASDGEILEAVRWLLDELDTPDRERD